MVSTFKIKGMSCEHCVKAVTRALSEIPGVSEVVVNLETGEASFHHQTVVDRNLVDRQIKDAGYELG